MEMLLRGDIRDPAVGGVFVTSVGLSDDLRHARVYVRTSSESDPAQRKVVLRGLQRAAGFIRRELSPRLKLKYLPELRFYWDEGVDQASRVEELLSDLRAAGELSE